MFSYKRSFTHNLITAEYLIEYFITVVSSPPPPQFDDRQYLTNLGASDTPGLIYVKVDFTATNNVMILLDSECADC